MSLDRDHLRIALIGEAAADIQRRLNAIHLEAFVADRDEVALTAFRLSIIGENSNKLSDELKNRHPDLPWLDMIAFRNIVAHEYHRVDPIYVWEAVLTLGAIEAMVDTELSLRNK
ncbi:MAG: hypothetical protein RL481_243 [Pseudomonadota bacterium]|jgi:uncharacterized protein with HEPN domain